MIGVRFVNSFRIEARSDGLFLLLWHFRPPRAGNGLIFNRRWESMDYKGAFCGEMLRKCKDGMECRHTEQRMKLKMES